jgi:ABC-type oligopeptide transport system substrate-binding subunit
MGLPGKSFCLTLAAVTLLSSNMCFLKEVAAKPHSHESAAHPEESVATAESHHQKSEDPCAPGGVVCCEDIVAVQPALSTALTKTVLQEEFYQAPVFYQAQTTLKRPQYEYQIDFSPGNSPPALFLFSNTNHAPPLHA